MAVSRKIAEGIYGGHQPRDVAAAVALGIVAGTLAGGNLSWAPVLLAAILFNIHTRLFLAAWLASVLIAWLSGGWLETLGQFLLDGTPIGRTIGLLGDSTLVALLGWDEYALLGGLAAGVMAAGACAPTAYWLTCRLDQRRSQTIPSRPSSGAEPQDRPQRNERPLVRVWYGASGEQAVRQTMAPRRLRPYGIPATLAAGVTVAVASWSFARLSAERELWRQLSIYNGAQVSGASVDLSLSSGDFIVHDLEIADAARPDRDRFRVGLAKGRLSPGPLLRGRLNIEKLVLSRVRVDVARGEPAQLCDSSDVTQDVTQIAEVEYHGQGSSASAGDLEVSSHLHDWPSVCRRLGALEKLVAAIERLARAEETRESSQAGGRLTRRRSDLGQPEPRVFVQEMRVDGLPSAWDLGRKAIVEIANLASNPSLLRRPAQVKILLPKFGAELQLDFASDRGRRHTLRCSACDLDVGQWLDGPLAISGQARLAGQGSFDYRGFHLRVLVEVEPLVAELTGTQPLAGVEPELWNWALGQLATFKADAVCSGPWESPVVTVGTRPFVEQFKRQLRAAGHEGLAAAVEQQIARYIERQAGLQEEQPAPVVVQAAGVSQPSGIVQATGIELAPAPIQPQQVPAQPGLCEFSTEDECQVTGEAGQSSNYPTTSFPYDDSAHASFQYDDSDSASPRESYSTRVFPGDVAPNIAQDSAPAEPPAQRPLPGPVNMVVGRDRYTGPRTPLAAFGVSAEAPRESAWSRWTQGLRRKFSQAFAKPEPAPPESFDSGEYVPQEDDQPAPAAASEAWYNRRWR